MARQRPGTRVDWLTQITALSLATILGFGISSLVLSMLGFMRTWIAIPIGLGASYLASRWIEFENPGRRNPAAELAALVLIAGVLVIGLVNPHEHFLATRDSGTYVSTAAWVANTGSLGMDVASPMLDGLPVEYETLGFQARSNPSSLMPQFLHLFPSLLALAGSVGGLTAMYALTPVIAAIGLLCFFSLVRSLTSPWMAVLATAAVGASLPFLYFSRAPFTEALAFTLGFGALCVARKALSESSLEAAGGAGLLFGGLMLTRVDGVVVLLGLASYRTLLQIRSSASEREDPNSHRIRAMDRMINVAVVLFGLAMIDAALFSTQYLVDHGTLVAMVLAAILVVTVIGRSAPRLPSLGEAPWRVFADVTAGLLALYLGYAWLVRPLVEATTKSDVYGISGLQRAAGVAIEPLRSYAELSVHWLVWYLGIPLVAVGLGALVWLVRRAISDPGEPISLLTLVVTVSTLLYVYRPSINPDHIWAMRRFVPLVLPGIVLLAVVLLHRAVPAFGRFSTVATGVVAVAFVVPVLITSQTAGLAAEFDGAGDDLGEACEKLGSGSILVFVGEASEIRSDALGPPLRGLCEMTVAVENPDDPLEDEDLARLRKVSEADRPVWLVSDRPESERTSTVIDESYEFLELSLFGPPSEFLELEVRLRAEPLLE